MSKRPEDAVDARMRRLFAGVDTVPGFEARLARRVAALPVVARGVLRERADRGREREARRLRREAFSWAATAATTGAAGLAIVWRNGPAVAERVLSGLDAATQGGSGTLAAIAVLAALIWPFLPRSGGAGA